MKPTTYTTAALCAMAFAALACATPAMADESFWYAGASAARTRATIDDARISSGLLGGGFTATSISNRENDTGYTLYAGRRLNSHFAIEGGYFDLGKFGFTATTAPAGSLRGDIRLSGYNLDAVGIVPITEKLSASLRLGGTYVQARDSFSGTGAVTVVNPNPHKRAANYKFGAGLQYDVTPSLGIRAEAERYRVDDAVGNNGHVDTVSLGLVYSFGRN